MNRKHARFWRYDGNHHGGRDCERYDPHGFGLRLIRAMAYHAEHEYSISGVSLRGVIVNHHQGDDFGHQIHVAATAQQWAAMRKFIEENPEYC